MRGARSTLPPSRLAWGTPIAGIAPSVYRVALAGPPNALGRQTLRRSFWRWLAAAGACALRCKRGRDAQLQRIEVEQL